MAQTDDRMISFQDALAKHLRKYQSGDRLTQEAQRLGVVEPTPSAPACDVCCDRGKIIYNVPVDDPRFGKLFPCPNPQCPTRQRHLLERQTALVKFAQIPEHYQNYTFQTWMDAASHRTAKDNWFVDFAYKWIEAPGHYVTMPGKWLDGGADVMRNGLIFAGGFGVGKTGLTIAMIRELIARNEQAMYIRTADYFKLKYRTYRKDADDSHDEAVDLVQTAPILMLDDFNVENKTDNMQDVMEDRKSVV